MGFLDVLKGIGKAINPISPYIDLAGEVAGAISGGRAKGRAAETVAGQAQDRTAIDRYQTEQQAKLQAAQLLENATKDRADRTLTDAATRAKQVAFGDILANVQPARLQGLPSYIPHMSFSGGAINALGPMARQAGTNLAQQALLAQMSGSDIPALPTYAAGDAPPLTPVPQAGKLDTILNTVGAIGLGAQGYGEIADQRKKAAAAAAARNNPQEIPVDTTGASTGTTTSGVAVPGVIGQLLRMRQMQQQKESAD